MERLRCGHRGECVRQHTGGFVSDALAKIIAFPSAEIGSSGGRFRPREAWPAHDAGLHADKRLLPLQSDHGDQCLAGLNFVTLRGGVIF